MEEQSKKTKFITKDIMKSAVIGSFQKLDPRYAIKNPVMFVVELLLPPYWCAVHNC
ncbi:MAG: hypothetical protein ACLRUZ_14085 [Faecalimonas sp.]